MTRNPLTSFALTLFSCAAFGQTYTISTVAGSSPQPSSTATSAILGGSS